MKVKNDKDKNNIYFQDINSNDKTFTYKTFQYFYSLFQEKKEHKLFLKFILIFIETIQFISYAFSSNHYNSWKLERKTIILIENILSGFRLSSLINFISYKIYMSISMCITIIIFILCLIVLLNILFIDSSSRLNRYT